MKYYRIIYNDNKENRIEISETQFKKEVGDVRCSINAKEELKREIRDIDSKVFCAKIRLYVRFYLLGDRFFSKEKECTLKKGYSKKDFENFLEELNFEYYDGFGSQELFGTVWLKDGSWLERSEYDGSENWVLRTIPEIPKELL